MNKLDQEIQADLDRERERRSRSVRFWNKFAIIGAIFFGWQFLTTLLNFRGQIFYLASVFVLMLACMGTIDRRSWWK